MTVKSKKKQDDSLGCDTIVSMVDSYQYVPSVAGELLFLTSG
jgi:hypothetical protein